MEPEGQVSAGAMQTMATTSMGSDPLIFFLGAVALVALVLVVILSLRNIGPTEVGLLMKRFSWKKLSNDNPIAFNGEAGYQAEMLMPGLRWKLWPLYKVEKFPWVQVPAGEIGVVISQVGKPLPIGAKSGKYKTEFANFSDLRAFVNADGEKGVQRPVLPPGTMVPIHPIGFLVITKRQVYGVPIDDELAGEEGLTVASFGLKAGQLELVRIVPEPKAEENKNDSRHLIDMIGIVTTYEGEPLPSGDIAGRLGGFADITNLEQDQEKKDSDAMEVLLGSQNNTHNNYQDFQKFLDSGGKIGLQHDPLLYGAYTLNPFLVSVERVPMLVVNQGQVAVIKAFVGLPTLDMSGAEFKFGSIVRPGHRGVWREALRTGKYALNPRCYSPEIVPTAILTLNWAEATSKAHNLDAHLSQITAKSKEGFVFKIDLQVQIHVPDTDASKVISMVGTIENLVNEVLQPAVGNHFRDKLQGMPAIDFIEKREEVQKTALAHIKEQLESYKIETRGVYIQDVVLPEELVTVLKSREVANQQIKTYVKEKEAEDKRAEMELAKGKADKQNDLGQSEVEIKVKENKAQARQKEGRGEASYTTQTGKAKGAEVEAIGLARAKGFTEQKKALGDMATALVNVIAELSQKNMKIVPDVLVAGGGSGGAFDALVATITDRIMKNDGSGLPKVATQDVVEDTAQLVGTSVAKVPIAEKSEPDLGLVKKNQRASKVAG